MAKSSLSSWWAGLKALLGKEWLLLPLGPDSKLENPRGMEDLLAFPHSRKNDCQPVPASPATSLGMREIRDIAALICHQTAGAQFFSPRLPGYWVLRLKSYQIQLNSDLNMMTLDPTA